MSVHVYTITYNEAFMLPYFIKHYRSMFPGCEITVYDNESTDDTPIIAMQSKCNVITYRTGDKLDDVRYLQIKNNCWKKHKGWVIVADCDEFCDINEGSLMRQEGFGYSIISFEGYNIVNLKDDMDFDSIHTGVRSTSYDKMYCFNTNYVIATNYEPGCHTAKPNGILTKSRDKYRCRHYKYLNPQYMLDRHRSFASRLSEVNIKYGYGGHYLYTEQQIRDEWKEVRSKAIKLF